MNQQITPLPPADVLAAIRQAYDMAGIDLSTQRPGIVPLFTVIEAFPIRVEEITDLNYRRAVAFLQAETGRDMPIPTQPNRALAGYLYVYEYSGYFYGCILTNKSDPVSRRRFTGAHELGHYLLHFLPLLEARESQQGNEALVLAEGLTYGERDSDDDLPSGYLTLRREQEVFFNPQSHDIRQMEREANQFAADLLMPSEGCAALIAHFLPRYGSRRNVLAKRLATELLVSQTAMLNRLKHLNLPDYMIGN